jgi:hypothetical protein
MEFREYADRLELTSGPARFILHRYRRIGCRYASRRVVWDYEYSDWAVGTVDLSG